MTVNVTGKRLRRHVRPCLSAMLLASASASAVLLPVSAASAQSARSYHIPAGSLATVLNDFAEQSGVQLIYAGALVDGRGSAGLKGSFGTVQALSQLLAGSGVSFRQTGANAFTLERVPEVADGAVNLGPVRVEGSGSTLASPLIDPAITEGTGSYTTRSASTATGMALSLRETPQSISVITQQRMQDQGLTQLTDVAIQAPGMSVSQSGNVGSDSSPIYSRGFAVDSYMVDGVKLLGSYDSIFQNQDMALYDRVEIVRGSTGLMNGAGTASATINLIRKKPTRDFQASALLTAGSWDYRRIDADVSFPLVEGGAIRARIVGALQDAGSYIDRLQEDRSVIYGVVEADLGQKAVFRVGASNQQHDSTGHARSGLPAYYSDGTRTEWKRSDSAAADWAYSKRHSTMMFAELDYAVSDKWLVKASATRTITDSDELVGYASGGYPDRNTGAGVNIWATHWVYKPKQNIFNLSATGTFSLFGRDHDLAVGGTLARAEEDRSPNFTNWWHAGWSNAVPNIFDWDGRTPAPPANPAVGYRNVKDRNDSAFASVRLRPTDSLSFILGSRITNWSRVTDSLTYATNITRRERLEEKGKVIPYAGIVYDFTENVSAYLSYTTIFEAQSLRTVDGDFIPPLMGNTWELGAKAAFFDDRLNISAAVYRMKQDNLGIAIVDVFAPDGSQAYEAVSGTKSKGFEFEATGQVSSNWELSASFSHNTTKDRLGIRLNTQVPQDTAKLFTTYKFDGIVDGLVIGGGARWQSRIYSDNQGPLRVRYVQPSYVVIDAMARYRINENVEATVNLYNLFDKSYFTTTGTSYYGAPRSVRAGVNVKF